ncbi:MAG TPA: hypothetical protein VMF59_06100 [Bacteroidota bacterium]|nr:hypothetical protein [Bacteroidota bacterium]
MPGQSQPGRNALPASMPPDPVERYVPLLFKIAVYAILTVFFFQALDAFYEYRPGMRWGTLLFIVRTFTFLPLHEGGHFISMFLGRTLYVLGGSFWQIVFPLLWFIIALRQRSQVFPFPLFWTGENMMDVSLYVRDAPGRMLPLLGGDKSGHDWHYLLTAWGCMDDAGTIADIMYYCGVAVCIAAICTGVVMAVIAFVRSGSPGPAFAPSGRAMPPRLQDDIDREVRKIEGLPEDSPPSGD